MNYERSVLETKQDIGLGKNGKWFEMILSLDPFPLDFVAEMFGIFVLDELFEKREYKWNIH